MIHGMNAQCETLPRHAPNPANSVIDAANGPSVSAQIANSHVSLIELNQLLQAACEASILPEFAQSSGYLERHAERSRFSPSLSFGRHFCPPLPTARPAAVMIMIEPRDGQWVIPLTVRPNHLPDHPGQVCLPGGRVEAGESTIEAAEREYCEELGVAAFPGRTLGQLQSIYVYNSDYYMTPCVAVSDRAHPYLPNPDEVASLVYLPVADLLCRDLHVMKSHQRELITWTALGIEVAGVHVWGATAIVLGELAAVLSQDNVTVTRVACLSTVSR